MEQSLLQLWCKLWNFTNVTELKLYVDISRDMMPLQRLSRVLMRSSMNINIQQNWKLLVNKVAGKGPGLAQSRTLPPCTSHWKSALTVVCPPSCLPGKVGLWCWQQKRVSWFPGSDHTALQRARIQGGPLIRPGDHQQSGPAGDASAATAWWVAGRQMKWETCWWITVSSVTGSPSSAPSYLEREAFRSEESEESSAPAGGLGEVHVGELLRCVTEMDGDD